MKVRFNTPPADASELNGLPMRYAAARRQLPRLRWYVLLLLVTAPLFYLAIKIVMGVLWASNPGFVTISQAVLKAGAGGRVEFLVREGDIVNVGAVIAKVYPAQNFDFPLPAPSESLLVRQLEMDEAKQKIGQATASLRLAQEQHERMSLRLTTVNRLISEGAATGADRAQAESQLTAAKSDMLRAKADLDGAQMGLKLVRARQATRSEPDVVVPQSPQTVVAPQTGLVVRKFVNSQDWVSMGSDLLQMQSQDEPVVRVFINPSEEDSARVGARADLHFMDGGKVKATVIKIEPEAARVPPERLSPLASSVKSIVAVLKPDQPLEPKYRISELPLEVRFNRVFLD